MGVFLRHNNILIDLLTTPAPCVLCPGQAARRAFDKGNTSGLALQNSKVPAVPEVLSGCVVAQEKPPCARASDFRLFLFPVRHNDVCDVHAHKRQGKQDERHQQPLPAKELRKIAGKAAQAF